MYKLDRIFCTTGFDSLFPLASARALTRAGSDHTPIIWESGETHLPRKVSFKFEKWWLGRADFRDLVVKAWSASTGSRNVVDKWQKKVIYFRRLARGWNANLEASIRREKKI